MLRVGLTGGIASGKTTVGAMFVELGCHLIDSDQITHELLEPGQEVHRAVIREFGPEITTPDGPVLMALETETGRDGRVRAVIDMDAFGDKQSFEMIIAKPYVYVEVPDRGWTQVSAAAMAEFTGQSVEVFSDPTALYGSLFPVEDVPWELYVVESLGHEEVEGIQTEHLSIQLDFQEIWQRLDEKQKQQLLQASPDPDIGIEELVEALEVKGVEVWIDDRGYSRRTVMEIVFVGERLTSLGGGEMSMKMDMRMFDF